MKNVRYSRDDTDVAFAETIVSEFFIAENCHKGELNLTVALVGAVRMNVPGPPPDCLSDTGSESIRGRKSGSLLRLSLHFANSTPRYCGFKKVEKTETLHDSP
jgi:hypothetical protein